MLNIRDLDYSNYSQYFNNLLYIEELQMRKDIDRYTMPNAQMLKDSRTNLLTLKVNCLLTNVKPINCLSRLLVIEFLFFILNNDVEQ